MKTNPRLAKSSIFKPLEVILALLLLTIAFGLCFPVITGPMTIRISSTKALSNAKQIALALKLYADDNQGSYPSVISHNHLSTSIPVTDSNTLFAQLFPDYIQSEAIFWLRGSAFCSTNPPDEIQDNPPLDIPVLTLKAGENEWAFVLGLNNASNPDLPIIADGFANPTTHTYVTDPSQKGGVRHGQKAVVVHIDCSAAILPVDQATMTVTGPNAGPTAGDIFTTAHATAGWLQPENTVVNPK